MRLALNCAWKQNFHVKNKLNCGEGVEQPTLPPRAFPYFPAFLQSLHLRGSLSSVAVTPRNKIYLCNYNTLWEAVLRHWLLQHKHKLRVCSLSHTKLAAWVRKDDLRIFLQMGTDLCLMEVWVFWSVCLTLLRHCTPSWGPGFLLSKFKAYSCEIECSGLKPDCLIQWEIHGSSLAEPDLSCLWWTGTALPGCICNSFSHVHRHVPGKTLKYHIFSCLFISFEVAVLFQEHLQILKKHIAMYCMLYNVASDVPLFGCKP